MASCFKTILKVLCDIGHEFQNPSLSNRGYVQNHSFENEFFFMRIKSFHINSFAFTVDLPSSRVLDNSEIAY